MTCPICFFQEAHQKKLKKLTFGIDRFENKLIKYKEIFIDGINKIDSLTVCDCKLKYNHPEIISWTDSFLETLKESTPEAAIVFDKITSIYQCLIEKNVKIASENLWDFLVENKLLNQVENSILFQKLLFRARVKDGFDETNPEEYFHIPFSKRQLVGNQRFSSSGQPMLYLGSSVLAITKELGHDSSNLSFAAFLPSYS